MNSEVVIVMIEDDAGHAVLIERNIRRAAVANEIIHFTGGGPALEYLRDVEANGLNGRPILILLDLNLPDMSGLEILEYVKRQSHIKRAPVIVLTTADDEIEIKRCYDLGCNVYITKPVEYDKFANAIKQLGLFFAVIKVPELING